MAHTTFRKIAVTTVGLALSAAGILCVLSIEGRFARAEAPQQAPTPPPAPAETAKAPAEPPPSPSALDELKKGAKRAARKLRPARGY
jgi:hypothetical protein